MYTDSMGKVILIVCIFSLCIGRGFGVSAASMKSGEFRIENSTIDVSPQEDSLSSYDIATTFGQLGRREFQRKGWVVRLGLEESQLVKPYIFGISKTNVIFEDLKANKPLVKQTQLSISTDKRPYEIVAIAEGPLQSKNGAVIEHTKCDSVRTICLDSRPAPWISSRSYGLGYSLDGRLYRPFPDKKLGDMATTVASEVDGVKENSQKDIFLKVNVDKNQENNNYQTVVNIIFIPLL